MAQSRHMLTQAISFNAPTTTSLLQDDAIPYHTQYYRRRGRPSMKEKAQGQQYLTPDEEKALVEYLLLMSELGQPVRIKYIPSLAFSLARRRTTTTGKPIKLPGKNWARSFEKRNPRLKGRRVKAIDWKRHERNIYTKVTHWFEVIKGVLQDPRVRPENVYNMDETGVMLNMLGSVKVLVSKDDLRDYRGAGVKRTQVTAIECISADGRSLLPLIIWPASTHRSNWTTFPTPGWHYGHSENGYNDSKISLEWLTRVFDPQTSERANGKPRVLICDGFGTHETLEILEFCFANNITMCRLPSHTSHKLQPCDVGVFGPLKTAYRDEVERLCRGGLEAVSKEHFTSVYKPARETAITRRNIIAAWAASGLFPFNPERVLRKTPKPPSETAAPGVLTCPQDQQVAQAPITPITPVTTEGVMSLHNLIKQDAYAMDERRLQKYVQKLASVAQISLAKQTLLQDQNEFLTKVNKEAQVRRSTRSIVLGKAKVMSFEDLEEARAKRAEKEEKASAAKVPKKRGRKPKNSAVVTVEEVTGVAGASLQGEGEEADPPVRADNMPGLRQPETGLLWKAPVAKMY
ncbi:hypothetical protein yc1106_09444 [Curvularia clavata]|uniref:HTH CENPB-type domain-containing protein n=2 Tax=Pleosporaceae TaxID=28556 RepID=A0A9Q8ZH98_CURCL|nr:hypothetical protein yc1106_09444 [Curvularia clavata]